MDILAVVSARNEASYLAVLLPYLIEQGIKVAVIDNQSQDETAAILRRFSRRDLLKVDVYPYPGYFDLQGILKREETLRREIGCDWAIHHDADEIMESCRARESLADGIRRVAALGFDAINFDEFVFLPEDEQCSYVGRNYYRRMRYYYYFAPRPLRLIRAFRNCPSRSNVESGGHRLAGNTPLIYPESFVLRHYICLSAAHGRRKYLGRVYSHQEVKKGWHANRALIEAQGFVLPHRSRLDSLSRLPWARPSASRPHRRHFWQWNSGPATDDAECDLSPEGETVSWTRSEGALS